jgi:hypothetical protein
VIRLVEPVARSERKLILTATSVWVPFASTPPVAGITTEPRKPP